jgi:hypothetical protein
MTIKNFDALKEQLRELHPILNAFKSEAVQLRIVELIWDAAPERHEPTSSEEKPRRRARGGRHSFAKSGTKVKAAAPARKTARGRRPGPGAVLNELVDEGFFKERRMLKDIVEHASSQKARKFKQNEFSGTLGRLIRDTVLKRKKNTDGQYEYYK